MRLIERIWRGDDAFSRAARIALLPMETGYRVATAARDWMYEHDIFSVEPSAIPVISVGNLSVGGTGKTPFTAWVAQQLAKEGHKPAIVLRGYGGDEVLVHQRLNPGISVLVAPHRAQGIARASEQGATVAVLDDAFQHRAAAREVDIALLAAEQWGNSHRLLPAGPWREPLSAVRRASLVVITCKTADAARIDAVRKAIAREAPSIPQAVVRFQLAELRAANNDTAMPLSSVVGRSVIGVAGVADPTLFFEQLVEHEATVVPHPFPDHHEYSNADVTRVLATAGARDALVVCTLKDAVKLAPIWPATAPPLWYVLQSVKIESGEEIIAGILSQITS